MRKVTTLIKEESVSTDAPNESVSRRILKSFFEELNKKDLGKIPQQLEEVILKKESFSEPDIRSALFEEL